MRLASTMTCTQTALAQIFITPEPKRGIETPFKLRYAERCDDTFAFLSMVEGLIVVNLQLIPSIEAVSPVCA